MRFAKLYTGGGEIVRDLSSALRAHVITTADCESRGPPRDVQFSTVILSAFGTLRIEGEPASVWIYDRSQNFLLGHLSGPFLQIFESLRALSVERSQTLEPV